MSSELFIFDNSFFSDPFSPFSDSATTIDHHHHHHHDILLQTLPDDSLVQDSHQHSVIGTTPVDLDDDANNPFDQIASILLSSSPPSHQLENLSLCQNGTASSDSPVEYAELSSLEIKTEESHVDVPLETFSGYGYSTTHSSSSVPPQVSCLSLAAASNAAKLMQRSFSSNSFDNKPNNYVFQPCFDSLLESQSFQNQIASSPESSSFSSNQMMRRVCSTGDLQKMKTTTSTTRNVLSSSPLSTERSYIEEAANIKVGRYSAEERKERIDRYRAKRTQRNFNKTIKYACRKTLADNRPRIRGRFARNDEAGEILPRTAMFSSRYRFEDEEDLCWPVEGFQEEAEEDGLAAAVGRRAPPFFNATQQYQYFSYS